MAQTGNSDTTQIAEAKDSSKTIKKREITKMPEFPGGKEALNHYLKKKTPVPVYRWGSGRIIVRFIVSETGKIQDVEVIESNNWYYEKSVVHVIKSMPDWTPGQSEGKNVKVSFTIPFIFTFQAR